MRTTLASAQARKTDAAVKVGRRISRPSRGRNPKRPPSNARLPMHMKKVFQRAADIRHQTLTEFVLGSAYDRAMATILDDTVLRLSERDGEAFASALSEPGPIKEAVLARFRAASESGRRRATP
jgi:uncharacterized protein (DUF1778 family)